jgi:hypothetical protein
MVVHRRPRRMIAELAMVTDALRVLSPLGVLRQNLALLKLVIRTAKADDQHQDLNVKGRAPPISVVAE